MGVYQRRETDPRMDRREKKSGNGTVPRARLLFVDHSQLMRKAADRILGDEFRVLLAEDTQTAWIILQDDPLIQVVFYDQDSSEDSDGLELLKRIRSCESRRVRSTPVVIITDDDDSEAFRQTALNAGATDFIDKPFRPSELLARARAHASTTEAVQRLRLMQRRQNKDGETGLGNRRYFFERLAQALSFTRRHHQPLSLVHIHLDGLSSSLKQQDALYRKIRLAKLGRMLHRAIRQEDTVYRTGPETFSFILPGTNEAGAEAVRCRLVPELDAMGMLSADKELGVTARFIVQSPRIEEDESVLEALRRIREGMGTLLIDHEVLKKSQEPEPHHDDIDSLLELARHGDIEQVREHLPEVLAKLKPLLELASELGNLNEKKH